MMRQLLISAALLLLLLTGTGPAAAQEDTPAYDVLLDNSGSMLGFKASPVWTALLDQLDRSGGRNWVFDSQLRPHDGRLSTATLNSDDTDLGEAITDWMARSKPGAGAFIVTDNVADSPGRAPLPSQVKWEAALQSGSIAHLVLAPVRLPFDGPLYSPDSPSLTTPRYPGQRALALYLVVKASDDREHTLAQVKAMEAKAHAILDPLARQNVQYVWLTVTPFDVSGQTEKQFVLKLTETSQATATLTGDTLEVRNLTVGDSASFGFEALVSTGQEFTLKDAEIKADLLFDDHGTLVTDKLIDADVDPKKAVLGANPSRFTIKYDIRPFRLVDLSGWDLLMLALSNETPVKGKLRIRYRVERGMVDLSDDVTRAWSYDGPPSKLHLGDTSIQSRIYRLTELVRQSVRKDALEQNALVIDVVMHVNYPLRPVAIAALLLLAGLAGLAWALAQMSRPRPYVGQNDISQEQTLTPSLLTPAYMVSSDGRCEVTVRWLLVGILVTTNGRLTSPRLLPAGGGAIEVTFPDADGGAPFYSFYLEPLEEEEPMSDLDAEYNS